MGKKSRAYAVFLEIRGKDKFSAQFAKAGKSLRSFGGFLSSPLRALDKLGGGLGGFLEKVPGLKIMGETALWAGKQLKGMALGAAEFGSNFNDLSVQSGIGTRQLQEIAYAADQAGVPFEEFRASVQRMSATLGKGIGRKQLFASLGKDTGKFVNALKKAKGPGDKFEVILAQMAKVPNATKRAAFGMQFFGRAGVKLAGLAGDGADGIRKMREEAQELGLVMGEDEIKRADKFGDTWAALGKVFESGKRDFGSGLIAGLLPDMEELLGDVKANRREIGLMIKDLGRDVGHGLIDGAKGIKDAFMWSKGAVEWLGGSGLELVGAGLALLAKNPFFAAILAAKAAIEWLIDNTPKPAEQAEKDNALIAAHKQHGTLGGAMAVMGGETQGQMGPLGWAAGIVGVGDFVANQDDRLAEAGDRQRQANFIESESFNEAQMMRVAAERALQFSGTDFARSTMEDQSIEVKVVVEDKGGNTDGDPVVKATPGVKAKAKTVGTGTRTTSHLKGGG